MQSEAQRAVTVSRIIILVRADQHLSAISPRSLGDLQSTSAFWDARLCLSPSIFWHLSDREDALALSQTTLSGRALPLAATPRGSGSLVVRYSN